MSSEKKNLCEKEISSADKNYQLNMEILSSLKSIPGKIVNLQSGNFINDEFNKRLINPEGKKTTSSSISKLSKDFFYEQIDDKALNKKINTTYSVFRPMTLFPNKRSTMNYFPFNTLMSFPDIYLQNPINNAPPKITNSSYSKNSFCVMPPNMEQNINLYNQINLTGNQMNTLTQINQNNQFNFFGTNPFNSFNTLNLINPNVNMAPQNQLNELQSLRRKAGELEILKSQLKELNALRMEVAEYHAVKDQLKELAILKEKITAQNKELDILRLKAKEADRLRLRVEELEN